MAKEEYETKQLRAGGMIEGPFLVQYMDPAPECELSGDAVSGKCHILPGYRLYIPPRHRLIVSSEVIYSGVRLLGG